MDIDSQILKVFQELKTNILLKAKEGDADGCLTRVLECWRYMNRFRNCALGIYFDEDIHDAIASLNPHRFDTSHLLKPKKEFRIAYILSDFNDLGTASYTHRFMLEDPAWDDVRFRQYVLITNITNRANYKETDNYRYLTDKVQVEEIGTIDHGLSWLERGKAIQDWLFEREIDFVMVDPCPASIYALASRPVAVSGILPQDCYTFTIGPGCADLTFLVTTDQVFKYRFSFETPEKRLKIIMLPLHRGSYVDSAQPLSLADYGIPEGSVVSGSTNMWKSCFGDSETLLTGIAELVRRHPEYHHVFAGTPRCLDNVEAFLARNPDVRDNIHFIGPVKNIYRLLKAIDFWVNSFPTSGGSDIECAYVGKPSIEFLANRDLDLHGAEFLRSRECDVISLDEFVALGDRLITDEAYRANLGAFLRQKISREFDKDRILRERVYGAFVDEFSKRLNDAESLPGIGLTDAIDYEKRIGFYSAHVRAHWPVGEKLAYLEECRTSFPDRPFAWVKTLELALETDDAKVANSVADGLTDGLMGDHRIRVLLALLADRRGNLTEAVEHVRMAITLAKYDEIPLRVGVRLLAKAGRRKDAAALCRRMISAGDEPVEEASLDDFLGSLPEDVPPLYYNY